MFQMKEQDKTPEKELQEMEISSLPNKELKVMVIKMFPKLKRRIDEQNENFNKEMEKKKVQNRSHNLQEVL